MSTNKSNKPELRFKGFSDDWEQRKFGEIAATRRGLTYKPGDIVDGGKRVLRSSNINEDTFEICEDDVFVNEGAVNIPYVKNGDILITSANGSSRLVGKHAIVRDIPENCVVHGGFMLLASSDEPEFVNALMSSQWYTRFINVFVAGGNGAIGNLNKNDLDEQIVLVPSTKERKKIGTYFSNLDNLITLHQRKCDNLKIIKKSMLNNLFPKIGEKVPKWRFKGFNNDWEQRKLDSISEIKTGPFGSTLHADDYVTDGIPIITTEHFKNGDLPTSKNGLPQVSDEDYKRLSSYVLNEGDIVFSRVGSVDINALVIPSQRHWLFSGRVLRVRPDMTNDSQFLHTVLETETIKADIRSRAVGQTMPSINTEILNETLVMMPQLRAEQEQIGQFFYSLNKTITLHQSEVERLKKVKQFFLKKMFV